MSTYKFILMEQLRDMERMKEYWRGRCKEARELAEKYRDESCKDDLYGDIDKCIKADRTLPWEERKDV